MKIALVMPPLSGGEQNSNSLFRFIHDCARARPYWNPFLYRFTRKIKCFDFDFYPNSLVQLGTVLKAQHAVKIFNFLEQDYFQEVIDFSPQVIGISCSGGGNLIWVDKVMREFKKTLNAKIFLGGPHVSLDPEQTLSTTVADYVFTGESDLVIPEVIEYIEGKTKELPGEGVCYRKNGQIVINPPAIIKDLSQLPVPDHSLMDISKYKSIGIEFSRGCPYSCFFCYLSGYGKRMYWRHRPVDSILQEIESLYKLTDMRDKRIYFLDVNFSGSNKELKRLLKEIIRRKIKISFWTGLDINIDLEALRLMKEAGCSFFYTGIETGAARRIASIPKLENTEKIEKFVKRVQDVGVSTSFNIILLFPGETKKDLSDTLKLCRKISRTCFKSQERLINLSFYPHIFRPIPGTRMIQDLIRQGWKTPNSFLEWGRLYSDIANGRLERVNFSKDLTRKDIVFAFVQITLLNARQIIRPGIFRYLCNKIKKIL